MRGSREATVHSLFIWWIILNICALNLIIEPYKMELRYFNRLFEKESKAGKGLFLQFFVLIYSCILSLWVSLKEYGTNAWAVIQTLLFAFVDYFLFFKKVMYNLNLLVKRTTTFWYCRISCNTDKNFHRTCQNKI